MVMEKNSWLLGHFIPPCPLSQVDYIPSLFARRRAVVVSLMPGPEAMQLTEHEDELHLQRKTEMQVEHC